MSSSRYIGRVGGLAVAFGVGAAVFGGAAVAWADEPSSDSSSAQSSSEGSTAGDSGSSSSQATNGGPNDSTSGSDSESDAPTGAVEAEADSYDSEVAEADVDALADAVEAEADSYDSEVADSEVAEADVADQSDETDPVAPVDAQLELALLASARPNAASAAAAPAAPTTAVDAGPVASAEAVAQNTGLILGGSGVPIPSDKYVELAFEKYVKPHSPAGTVPEAVFTPEGLYPFTGVKSLPLNTSVDQGNTILLDTIAQQVALGNTATVFGYSQSSIMSSLVMPDLDPGTPVQFVLVGNEMNPNGGFLSRFPGLNLPSLGMPFYGATPEDPPFELHNYTLEYDGFADFPQYPINVLSVINAVLGIVFVHPTYLNQTQEAIDGAIKLRSSSPNAHYYIIPTEHLPLLELVRLIPLIGTPIANLLEPILRPIVNLGYGDPNFGWSNEGDANVLQPFGFLPNIDLPETLGILADGLNQGVQDFVADFSSGGVFWEDLAALSVMSSGSGRSSGASDNIIEMLQMAVLDLFEFVSNAAASLYAALLPTADIVNAIVTMVPAYALNLALAGIQQVLSGQVIDGLLNMIGLPLAAISGLVTTSVLLEFVVIQQAVQGVLKGVA